MIGILVLRCLFIAAICVATAMAVEHNPKALLMALCIALVWQWMDDANQRGDR